MKFCLSLQLVDTKASNTSSLNLLHVVVGVTRRQFPHLLEFLVDLKSIEQASRSKRKNAIFKYPKTNNSLIVMASINDLIQQYTEMRKGLKDLALELGTRWQPEDVNLDEDDKFRDIMTKYNEDASIRFQVLESLYVNMDAKWKDAMVYYGENPKVMRPDDFFSTFARFVVSWKACFKRVNKRGAMGSNNIQYYNIGSIYCRRKDGFEARTRGEEKA